MITKKISLVILTILLLLIGFLSYVATKESQFNYQRSGLIKAPASKIYPYLVNFKLGHQWSPYEQKDPSMKKTFSGPEGQVGSIMEFEGNSEVGSGKLEILKMVPDESVEIRLTMLKPFQAENIVRYKLSPEANGTLFTWSMSGDGGFLGKLIATVIDCEKMVGGQFSEGIANLKKLIESQN